MSELKSCPFCGGEAEFERMGDRRQSCIVVCTDCGGRHESGDEGERSGDSWNQRAQLEAGVIEVDGLRVGENMVREYREVKRLAERFVNAKGRYHSQLAMCDLMEHFGKPCVRPESE